MLKLVESPIISQEKALLPHLYLPKKDPSVLDKYKEREHNFNFDCTVQGEQALWRAVITQALMDAGSRSIKREAKFHRAQAIAWFSKRNPDFQLVCALAGLDMDYVFDRAHKAIRQECKWRKEPNAGQKNKR